MYFDYMAKIGSHLVNNETKMCINYPYQLKNNSENQFSQNKYPTC